MNLIIASGNMTRDPEMRYGKVTGKGVCSFSIAVRKRFHKEGEPDAEFFDVVCFGKTAEYVEKYGGKGVFTEVKGSLVINRYKNRDGVDVSKPQINADEVQLCGKRDGSNNTKTEKASSASDGFMGIPDGIEEELPFGQ